jgi:hypothetical protein
LIPAWIGDADRIRCALNLSVHGGNRNTLKKRRRQNKKINRDRSPRSDA